MAHALKSKSSLRVSSLVQYVILTFLRTCYCNSTPVSVSLNVGALQTIEACFNDPIGCVLNNG